MYKATIYYRAELDDYKDGQTGDSVADWDETLTADTPSELRNKVLEATHSKWSDLNDEQINEYDWCKEYATSYMAIEENGGDLVPASAYELDEWRQGRETLYAVNCHILVTEVTEKKASL